jgi:hypothetical protein
MALVKSFTIPIPGAGDFAIPAAYCMIVAPVFDKLALAGGFGVAIWKDQATRAAFATAQADFVAKSTAFQAADAALKAFLPSVGDTDDKIKAKEAASIGPRATLQLAQIDLQNAVNACNALQQVKIGDGLRYSFDALTSSAITTNGEIDVVKCYAWLKTQPDWVEAQDV